MISDQRFKNLLIQHYILAIAHTSLGIGSVVLPILVERINPRLPTCVDEPKWIDCVNLAHEKYYQSSQKQSLIDNNLIRQFCKETESPGAMFINFPKYSRVDTQWFVFTFFVWTGLFHLFYATLYSQRYRELLDEDRCLRIRWLEYGFSAGIMIALIAFLSGIQNALVLLMMFKLFYVLIATAYYGDELPASWYFMSGYFQLWTWIFILLHLILPHADQIDNVPWFVFFVYGSEFILFNSFALIYLFERRKMFDAFALETMYNALSFVSKGLLMVVLTSSIFLVSTRN